MSATTENRGIQESSGTGVFERLDSFIVAAKHLETTLATERSQNRRLREEIAEREHIFDRQKKDSEVRVRELSISESKLRAALTQFQENERKLLTRSQSMTAELQKVRDELNQYRSAWNEVLQREREAKMILADSEHSARRLSELEATSRDLGSALKQERTRREQAERHAQSYQLELKNALVRIHSAEAKFNELTQELNAHRIARRSMEEEVAEVEKSLRERLDWESLKEREKLKAEMERSMAHERERVRQAATEQARLEVEPVILLEREQAARARDALDAEANALRSTLDQVSREREALRQELLARNRLEQESAQAQQARERMAQEGVKRETESIRRELTAKLMESQVALASVEAELRGTRAQAVALKKDQARGQELEGKVSALEAELKTERERSEARSIDELSSEKGARIERLAIREELANTQKVYESTCAQLQVQLQALRQNLEASNADLDSTRAELNLSQGRASELESVLAGVRHQERSTLAEKESLLSSKSIVAERAQSLAAALVSERERFEQTTRVLELDVERLKTSNPIQALLQVKQAEIERLQVELNSGKHSGSESDKAGRRFRERMSRLFAERDQLGARLVEMESAMREQLARIGRTREINTLMSGPAEP